MVMNGIKTRQGLQYLVQQRGEKEEKRITNQFRRFIATLPALKSVGRQF
jgi:hypothetical protein